MSWGSGPSRSRRAGRSGADDDDDGGFEQLAPGKSSGTDAGSSDVDEDGYTRTSRSTRRFKSSRSSPSHARADDSGGGEFDADGSAQAATPTRSGPSLKARAVGFLSRRDYARNEIASKLKPHADSEDELNKVLDDLEREGWLSTERFAQSLVHRRADRQGAARIVQELRAKGVAEAQVSELQENLRATEYERARAVWDKRFGERPAPGDRSAYAKQARFLAGRGFAHDVIRRILGGSDDDE
ncbi:MULTISPECIES: recombination regulator RecX [unclassified Achromobacter]|uniref:recombination regulator RecX n=1 Tax=unclassified Achromobacter TaxID=2626865 RepID=UPI000B518B36|nr:MULTISPECIES: recombination regulator RecX [unclassified Achromobacter]OWT77208.1 recombination regulator RecX [Achromobacter sp. HZ28]OWT78089.1 recombination regulator RecX [Achromobacter sp. HZ34]